MSSNLHLNEKTAFILALFAAFIALNVYSEFLSNVSLFFGPMKISFILVFNTMLLTLFVSIYFFALNYIKSDSIAEYKVFQYFQSIGNFFYALTLVILPIILLIHFLSYLIIISNISVKIDFSSLLTLLITIVAIFQTIISLYFSRRITEKEKDEKLKNIQINEEEAIREAEKLFKNRFYSAALIAMGKLIEITLKKTLLEKRNLTVERASLGQLVNLALKTELINVEIAQQINEIRKMRNDAAHLDIEFKKKDANKALQQTNRILENLDPKSEWN